MKSFMNLPKIVLSCMLTSACAVYPLPQQTTGHDTYQIVANVRCEARAAVREAALKQLESYTDARVVYHSMTGPELAYAIRSNPSLFYTIKIDDFKGDALESFQYYRNSQVAYDFTLQATESNEQSFDFSLLRTINLRSDTIGFKQKGARSRDVKRNFFVMDTFENLVIGIKDAYCAPDNKGPNLIYPIVGSLPIYDLIKSYIEANEFANLTGDKPGNLSGVEGNKNGPAIPRMADTIMFKTRFTGAVNPTFALGPKGPGFLLSNVTVGNENYREDYHQVIISVTTAEVNGKSIGLAGGNIPRVKPTYEARIELSENALRNQRQKNVDDAIVRISDSLSRFTQ